VLRISLELAIS